MSANVQMLPLSTRSRVLPMLAATGFGVGVVDITYAFVVYARNGVTSTQILQGIASGILGRDAFTGSGGAIFGLAIHFFIAYSVTAFYFFLAKQISWLNQHAILSGVLYGAGVYLFMHYVVIPLAFHRPWRMPSFLAVCEFVEHMLFVGLPIALVARSAYSWPQLQPEGEK